MTRTKHIDPVISGPFCFLVVALRADSGVMSCSPESSALVMDISQLDVLAFSCCSMSSSTSEDEGLERELDWSVESQNTLNGKTTPQLTTDPYLALTSFGNGDI